MAKILPGHFFKPGDGVLGGLGTGLGGFSWPKYPMMMVRIGFEALRGIPDAWEDRFGASGAQNHTFPRKKLRVKNGRPSDVTFRKTSHYISKIVKRPLRPVFRGLSTPKYVWESIPGSLPRPRTRSRAAKTVLFEK